MLSRQMTNNKCCPELVQLLEINKNKRPMDYEELSHSSMRTKPKPRLQPLKPMNFSLWKLNTTTLSILGKNRYNDRGRAQKHDMFKDKKKTTTLDSDV